MRERANEESWLIGEVTFFLSFLRGGGGEEEYGGVERSVSADGAAVAKRAMGVDGRQMHEIAV